VYGVVGDHALRLDLARPPGDGPFPAIVFVHGGGWSIGSRAHYRSDIEEAARRGYVAVTIDYRLTRLDPKTRRATRPFPAQIHDCKAAVRWLRAHAPEYAVDPARIGAAGVSAGAHLSLLLGLTGPDDGLEGEGDHRDQSSRVQAVMNVAGPTALARWFEAAPLIRGYAAALCDGTPGSAPECYRAASPVTYVTSDDAPVLSVQGEKDVVVPPEQARLLAARLAAAGVPHELRLLPDEGHGLPDEALARVHEARWAFFARHLAPSPR
jgi:acetyl esterase/lipase